MADITICKNGNCSNADNCWRFNAPPAKFWQSYCTFVPEQDGDEFECEFYVPYPDSQDKPDTPDKV